MYGDMSLEDVEEFEGLEPENGREINPEGRFQRDEIRNFDKDFEYELDQEGNERKYLPDYFDEDHHEQWDNDSEDSLV
jgi:hypothetical protein